MQVKREPVAVPVEPRGEDEVLTSGDTCVVRNAEVPSDDEIEGADMGDAIELLRKSLIMMTCIADKDLTPKLLKNHRDTLDRLCVKIEELLQDVEEHYEL